MAGHSYAEIACLPINEQTQERVKLIFQQIQAHEWEKLAGTHEFVGDQDDAIVYAVSGPHPGGMVILTRDPFELWADAEAYLIETATSDEMARISLFTPADRWKAL